MQEREVLWTTDANGRLKLTGIHDATLKAFHYLSREALSMTLHGQGRERTTVVLEQPHVVSIAELWEGSIVSDIHIWGAGEVPEETWREEDNGWNALLRSRMRAQDLRVEAERLARVHKDARLVLVSCSYGGAWSALAQRVRVTRRSG